jgi:valyl-tRNA synthetase
LCNQVDMEFSIRCKSEDVEWLRDMKPELESMSGAKLIDIGPDIKPPEFAIIKVLQGDIEIFTEFEGDIKLELDRKQHDLEKLDKLILVKKNKLENKNFVLRAPETVVQRERNKLAELEEQHSIIKAALDQIHRDITRKGKP